MSTIARLQDSTATLAPNTTVGEVVASPPSVHVLPAGTAALTSELFSSGGRPIAGAADSWTSNNTGVCTINSAGVITYVGDGTTTVFATKNAVNSNNVTVVCGAAVGGPNEPVGNVPLRYINFGERFPAGWENGGSVGAPFYEVINDVDSPGSAPTSPGAPNTGVFHMDAYTWEGTAGSGSTSSTIVFDLSASAVDGAYNNMLVSNDDNAARPFRVITNYVGSTRTASISGLPFFDPPQPNTWDTVPTLGSASRVHAMTPGSGTCRLDVQFQPMNFAPTNLYWCGLFKVNADFQINFNGAVNGSGVNKFVEFGSQSNYFGRGDPAVHGPEWQNASVPYLPNNAIAPIGVLINARTGGVLDSVDLPQNDNVDKRLIRDDWYFVECLVQSSSIGADDGTVQVWMQQVGVDVSPLLVLDYDAERMETPPGFLTRWTFYNIQNVYGGGGNPITADNEYHFADWYVSGGYVNPEDEPDAWVLTSYSGTTVAAGAQVNVVAQLVDSATPPRGVNYFAPTPTWGLTNGATRTAGSMYVPMTFSTGTTAPPASGGVRFNQTVSPPGSPIANVTHVYVSAHDRDGRDQSAFLDLVQTATVLVLQRESDGVTAQFFVNSAATGGSGATAYYDFAVEGGNSGDGTAPSNGANCLLRFSLGQGRDPSIINIPVGLGSGQTVVVTAEDYAIVNNDQQGRHRTSNTLTLTVA